MCFDWLDAHYRNLLFWFTQPPKNRVKPVFRVWKIWPKTGYPVSGKTGLETLAKTEGKGHDWRTSWNLANFYVTITQELLIIGKSALPIWNHHNLSQKMKYFSSNYSRSFKMHLYLQFFHGRGANCPPFSSPILQTIIVTLRKIYFA